MLVAQPISGIIADVTWCSPVTVVCCCCCGAAAIRLRCILGSMLWLVHDSLLGGPLVSSIITCGRGCDIIYSWLVLLTLPPKYREYEWNDGEGDLTGWLELGHGQINESKTRLHFIQTCCYILYYIQWTALTRFFFSGFQATKTKLDSKKLFQVMTKMVKEILRSSRNIKKLFPSLYPFGIWLILSFVNQFFRFYTGMIEHIHTEPSLIAGDIASVIHTLYYLLSNVNSIVICPCMII